MKTLLLIVSTILAIGTIFAIFMISYDKTLQITAYYDADYDDLVVRDVSMAVYKTVNDNPDKNCFTLSSDDLDRFPDDFLDDLNSAAQEGLREDPQIYPPGVYTGYGMNAEKNLVLDLVKRYNFSETQNVSTDNIASIPDYEYLFDCFFDYDAKQYMLRLEFQQQLHDGNFVNVSVTKNNLGVPHILNGDITVFHGGFNSTVLFHNNLDTEITLLTDEPIVIFVDEDDGDVRENRFAKTLSEFKTIIPPGKFFSYYFSPHKDKNDLPIGYMIKPFDLEGTVTVKSYPRCMTENEVASLYGTVNVYPKFPKYLPEKYDFECGVHNTNAFVHLVYKIDGTEDEEAATLCYRYQANYFLIRSGYDLQGASSLCKGISDDRYIQVCFKGIAAHMAKDNFDDIDKTQLLCLSVPVEYQDTCIVGAVESLTRFVSEENAHEFCDTFDKEKHERCKERIGSLSGH